MPKKPYVRRTGHAVYQLKITLRGIRPPIWRRFQVPSETTLHRLHQILQIVMGWTDSHMHHFQVGTVYYGRPDPDGWTEIRDERRVRLDQVLRRVHDRMVYEYDFGDSWEHDVVLEAILAPEAKAHYPMILAGRRACPPEDVGGVPGYYHFLQVLGDPHDPEHQDLVEWSGGDFDPDDFSVAYIQRAFHGGWGPARTPNSAVQRMVPRVMALAGKRKGHATRPRR